MDNSGYDRSGNANSGQPYNSGYGNQQEYYGHPQQQQYAYPPQQPGNGHHYAPNPNYNRQYSHGATSYAGSKHSLASARSSKSIMSTTSGRSVQAEYRDHKTQRKINSWYFGQGKRYMHIAIGLICGAVLLLVIFGTIMGLWREGRLHLSDKEEFAPYFLLIVAIILLGVSGRLVWEAKKQSTIARKNVAYKAKGADEVVVVDKKVAGARSQDNLKSGTYSSKAIGSTPNTTLNSIALSMDRSYMNHTMDRSTTRSLPSLDRSYCGDENADNDSRREDVF